MDNNLTSALPSEQWLQNVFNHAHDLIQIVRVDGSLIYLNSAWSEILGFGQEEISGKSIDDLIDKHDRARYVSHCNDVISGRTNGTPIVFNLVSRSGNKIIVEGIFSRIAENGKPAYILGIFRYISERIEHEISLKRLNQELKERQQNLRELLVYAPDAVVVIDQESRITFWNPKAEEIFGWSAEEVLDRSLTDTIVPEQHRAAHSAGMKRYLATGEIRVLNKTIEITALNKQGYEFYISLTISRTSQHSKTAFVAFVRDITDHKLAQLEIEKKTRQLEQSNQSLEAFAYAASHDLKQPIRKVQIFAEQLAKRMEARLDDEEKFYFQRIESATRKMRALIDDLLNFSSINGDRNFTEEVDLNQVLAEVAGDLEEEIQELGIKLTRGPLPVVKGDQRQLHQLFQNLISNSIKYRQSSVATEIEVCATTLNGRDAAAHFARAEPDKRYHLIQVRDNGIGFEQKNAERIFSVFARLHKSNEYSGSGIGLSIVLKVVENHQGYIKAESEPGKGATFSILFSASQPAGD